MRSSPVLLAAILLLAPASLGAQAGGEAELRATAERVAELWTSGGVSALGDLLLDRGVRFHAGPGGRETLDTRKATAALEDLLERRRTASARVVRVSAMEGSPQRGSAEIVWEAVAPGTSEVLRYTLFVGMVREDGRWRVYEIRVLP